MAARMTSNLVSNVERSIDTAKVSLVHCWSDSTVAPILEIKADKANTDSLSLIYILIYILISDYIYSDYIF